MNCYKGAKSLQGYETSEHHMSAMAMVRHGLKCGIPIILGYLPVAITFGVLAQQAGLSLLELTLMSVFVYAGASQFMGVNMIAASVHSIEIIVATFVLNFRHFVMSLSFMNEARHYYGLPARFGLSLLLTDEAFAVSAIHKDEMKKRHSVYFYTTIFLSAYLSWIIGSLLGGVVGEIMPERLSQSMGIALYAMFIGLLIPSVKKNIKVGYIALIAMLINLIASQFMSEGWAIVVGTVLGGLTGVHFLKERP